MGSKPIRKTERLQKADAPKRRILGVFVFPDAVDGFDSLEPQVLAEPANCKQCRLYRLGKHKAAAPIPGLKEGCCVRVGGTCPIPGKRSRQRGKLRLAAVRERRNQ